MLNIDINYEEEGIVKNEEEKYKLRKLEKN